MIFSAVLIFALSFAAFTKHAWEDYYITYRCSKNLATGHGLVYTVGERVHAFTSPLNALVPAALAVITGNTSDDLVLWLFRIVSGLLLAGAAVLLFESVRNTAESLIPALVVVGLFGLDAKIVDFSINGQETGFMMFFLALILHTLTVRSGATTIKLGLAWAGLMWTRPDGFIYIGLVALGFLLFNAGKPIGQSRLGLLKLFLGAGALTAVLYLPWLIWAWRYYGSPVPHTITAKGYGYGQGAFYMHPGKFLVDLLIFPFTMLLGETSVDLTFLPAFALSFGGWHWTAVLYGKILAYTCALYWLLPFVRVQARAVSFAFLFSHYYVSYVVPVSAPWYLPNPAILGILVFGYIVQHGLNLGRRLTGSYGGRFRRAVTAIAEIRVVAVLVLLTTLVLTLCAAYQLRVQQREIEEGNREQVGLWLRQNAASRTDTVFVEPLGYIGFFSQLKMLDYPGLCAPEVVAVERRLRPTTWLPLIRELRPDWLVLRPDEAGCLQRESPLLLMEDYSSVRVFDASQRVSSYRWLPGRGYLAKDDNFIVFRRNGAISPARTLPAS